MRDSDELIIPVGIPTDVESKPDLRALSKIHPFIWKSCCGLTVDKRLVLFLTQFIISFTIVVFSMVQLTIRDSCDNQIYIGLITTILGLFCPSPSIK